jgi:hypothetical protein
MTDITRRDALMLTAAIAATTSAVQTAQAQAPTQVQVTPNNSLIVAPTTTVANSSIPITISIPPSVFAPDGIVPTTVTIAMTIADVAPSSTATAIFTATLQTSALPPPKPNNPIPNIVVMTRLKIPPPPAPPADDKAAKPPAGDAAAKAATPPPPSVLQRNIAAKIKLQYNGKMSTIDASQPITAKIEDCALSDVSLLRLSFQPQAVSSNAGLMVRAVVPPAPAPLPASGAARTPSHKLAHVTCASAVAAVAPAAGAPPAPHFSMDVASDMYLSDEAFVGFSLYPTASGSFVMDWSYEASDGKSKNFDLSASAYAVVQVA